MSQGINPEDCTQLPHLLGSTAEVPSGAVIGGQDAVVRREGRFHKMEVLAQLDVMPRIDRSENAAAKLGPARIVDPKHPPSLSHVGQPGIGPPGGVFPPMLRGPRLFLLLPLVQQGSCHHQAVPCVSQGLKTVPAPSCRYVGKGRCGPGYTRVDHYAVGHSIFLWAGGSVASR